MNARLRRGPADRFPFMWEAWGGGRYEDWIPGRTVELIIETELHITTTDEIEANPNDFPPLVARPKAALVVEVDCQPRGGGRIAITYQLTDVQAPELESIGGRSLLPWALEQFNSFLDFKSLVIDLSGSIPAGQNFMNAGIAIDTAETRVIIRAEVGNSGQVSWERFRNGNVPDRLGPHDWSVFLRANDLKLALSLPVERALRHELGADAHKLISMGCDYNPLPGRAVFTLSPYLKLSWPLGVTAVPIGVTLSLDAARGRLVIDVDGYGIRELLFGASFASTVAASIINTLLPIVGWFVSYMLFEAVGGAVSGLTASVRSALGDIDLDGAPLGTTFEEVPGLPFRYRVTIPVATPGFVRGNFEALTATPDGVILAGQWRSQDIIESELTIDTSEFVWLAPQVACGYAGNRALQAFDENPKAHASLHAQVNLTGRGALPLRLWSVTALGAPGETSDLRVQWEASDLPSKITLKAPATFADGASGAPIRLEVCTSAGVFQASIPRPKPMTNQDIDSMRSFVVAQLRHCDSIVLPDWFKGKGKLDMSWLVDPLHDPDYGRSWVSVAEIFVEGLESGAWLQLTGNDGEVIARAPANAAGQALLAVTFVPGMQGAALSVGGAATHPIRADDARERSIAVTRELLELCGALRLPSRAKALLAAPGLSEGSVLVPLDDRILVVDATIPTRARLTESWDIPGAMGGVETTRGMLVYGEAGLFKVDRMGHVSSVDDEPVLDMVEISGGSALLRHGRLTVLDRHGVVVAEERVDVQTSALIGDGARLRVLSRHKMDTIELGSAPGRRSLRRVSSVAGLDAPRFVRSSVDGRLYGERHAGDGWSVGLEDDASKPPTTYATVPWQARAIRSGRFVLHADGVELRVFRSVGPREMVPVGRPRSG